tara:strand:+ start:459 stop:656 length:198 start_codon:yes stop_codon:yes gene_type:complete
MKEKKMSEGEKDYEEVLSYQLNDLQNQIDNLKEYVKHMTYFCSGVGVLLIFILYQLISKGIIPFF